MRWGAISKAIEARAAHPCPLRLLSTNIRLVIIFLRSKKGIIITIFLRG